MQRIYSVTFILRDGTKHAAIEKAKDHCKEKMLSILRPFVEQFTITRGQYLKCVEAVEDSTYDEVFSEYLAWRKEHDDLLNYEQDNDDESEV
jgi:hypothetical protein